MRSLLLTLSAALLGLTAWSCSGDEDSEPAASGGTGNAATTGGDAGAALTGSGGSPGSGGSGGGSGGQGTGGVSTAGQGAGGEGPAGAGGGSAGIPVEPWAPSQACIDQVATIVADMTLEEKVGQMAQAIGGGTFPVGDVSTHLLGSVAAGGNNDPPGGVWATHWADYADQLQAAAMSTRLGIPLLIGVDAVHGMSKAEDAVFFPHNIGLGCSGDFDLVERVGRITGIEMAGSGVNWTFAPTLAAALDERWGRTYEAFAESPDVAGLYGAAATLGLQDTALGNSGSSVLACAKHWAGDGATVNGINAGDVQMDEPTFRALAVDQYRPAIHAGAGSVMVSFSSWNGAPMHEHTYLVTDVLKGELGFQGFVISDWGGASDIVASVNAGLDMFMLPGRWASFISTLIDAVNGGTVTQARIDDAVSRILTVKCEMGLLDPGYTGLTDRGLTALVGSPEHRTVGREAVRKSIVMLQNDNDVLPLSKTARVHVTGASADSGDNQCGGWCVEWQGAGSRAVGMVTVLQAIQNVVGGGNVTSSPDGTGAAGADVVVAVIGEGPYAEGMGDSNNLNLSAADLTTLTNAASAGIPVVVVLISGRPMIITDQLSQADAWLAAWLPGTEGDGVADVLFGDYAPTAALTFTWPASMAQIPINQGDAAYQPLFPFGHGLSY